jgi:hypothetical protein
MQGSEKFRGRVRTLAVALLHAEQCVRCIENTAVCVIFLGGSGVDSARGGCWNGDRRAVTVAITVTRSAATGISVLDGEAYSRE